MWTPDSTQRRLAGRKRISEVTLFTIQLMGGGPTLHLSDRGIKVGSQWYLPFVKAHSGLSRRVERLTSRSQNPDVRIEFLNRRYASHARLSEIDATYPFTFAPLTVQRIFVDDDGTQSAPRTIFVGRLDGIDREDAETFTCGASHLSLYLAKKMAQETISLADFPGADPDAVGRPMPENFGTVAGVPCLATDAGAVTTLALDMTADQNTADLTEAQGETPLQSSGSAYVDQEKITWTGKTGKQLTGVSRGQSGTTAVKHDKGAKIAVVQSSYTWLANRGPMKSITGVLVDDVRQPAGGYTAYTGKAGDQHPDAAYAGRAAVRFTVRPTVVKQVNLSASEDGHAHNVGYNRTKIIGSSVAGTPPSGWSSPGGAIGNVADGIDDNKYQLQHDNYSNAGTIYVNFPAWTGPVPVSVTAYIKYMWYLNGAPDSNNYLKLGGTALTVNSPSPSTSSKSYGTSVPTQIAITYDADTGKASWFDIYEVWLEVAVDKTDDASAGVSINGNSTAETVVGRSVTIEGEGYQDNASGTYSGTANALLKNPAYLIKYLLMAWGGLTSGEIGLTFTSAASSLAAAGYEFAFQWDELLKSQRGDSGTTFPEWIEDLAFQARCAFFWGADGKAELAYIPDTAPSAVMTVDEADTTDGFRFGRTPETDVYNDFQAVYDRVYSGDKAGTFAGDKTDSDSTSQTRYGGVFHKRYELWAVRNGSQVTNWLAFRKTQEKDRLVTVDFDIWWRDGKRLEPGDTFDIAASLHNGMKFWVTSTEEVEDGFYRITGLGWPA